MIVKTKRGVKKSDVKSKKKKAVKDDRTTIEKNKGGRPRKYNSPEELEIKINEYFESCWVDKITEVTDTKGNVTMSTVRYQNRPYTVAGLAYELGFEDRHALSEYAKDDRFSSIIKKAKSKIEMYHEEELGNKNPVGHIFWLKNHAEYRDRQELEHTGKDGGPIEYSRLDLANRIASVLNEAKKKKEKDVQG